MFDIEYFEKLTFPTVWDAKLHLKQFETVLSSFIIIIHVTFMNSYYLRDNSTWNIYVLQLIFHAIEPFKMNYLRHKGKENWCKNFLRNADQLHNLQYTFIYMLSLNCV